MGDGIVLRDTIRYRAPPDLTGNQSCSNLSMEYSLSASVYSLALTLASFEVLKHKHKPLFTQALPSSSSSWNRECRMTFYLIFLQRSNTKTFLKRQTIKLALVSFTLLNFIQIVRLPPSYLVLKSVYLSSLSLPVQNLTLNLFYCMVSCD
jgi:hypothetical protein